MKLTLEGIKDREAWEQAGVKLPSYSIEKVVENTKENPAWVHIGPGNIFRIFIGGLADTLLEKSESETGIVCVSPIDAEIIDYIYKPHDNLVLAVTLKADGSTDKQVIGSLTEALELVEEKEAGWKRLIEIFRNPSLQMVSFTITEKGYALRNTEGNYLPAVEQDIANGPKTYPTSTMAIVCSLLWERYQAGKTPLAVVSMDNCSHNGEKLRASVLEIARKWKEAGYVDEAFYGWVSDETQVSFPWSMIDKITPRPADSVCKELEKIGIEDAAPIVTPKKTYIAPFVNAEEPQYLVIEDAFPNGRPALEKAGVYLTDRETVNKVERMKVTTCLNPLHTALAVYGCILGYTLIADEMKDAQLNQLVHQIGPVEGMPVVTDPGILSPKDFVDEVIHVRIPNPFMPDTPQRIATDTSQKVGIRYGETIKAYVEKYGDAKKLQAIPLAIAGWCRYLLGVNDEGEPFELSADPLLDELVKKVEGIRLGQPETYTGQLHDILSNETIFGINLYEAGIGEKIEGLFLEEIQGVGAVRKTLEKYLD